MMQIANLVLDESIYGFVGTHTYMHVLCVVLINKQTNKLLYICDQGRILIEKEATPENIQEVRDWHADWFVKEK